MELESLIKEYKKMSIEILDNLNCDNFDCLDELLDARGKIINNMIDFKSPPEEVKAMYEKHDVNKLDNIIAEKIELKKEELRSNMLQVKKRIEGTKSYNNLNTKAVFLSREV